MFWGDSKTSQFREVHRIYASGTNINAAVRVSCDGVRLAAAFDANNGAQYVLVDTMKRSGPRDARVHCGGVHTGRPENKK